jgi:hypothetical protein
MKVRRQIICEKEACCLVRIKGSVHAAQQYLTVLGSWSSTTVILGAP